MATTQGGKQRLRRASRGRGEAEENGRREDDAGGKEDAQDEEKNLPFDDSGDGVFSTLKDTVADAALAVLKPVAKRAATKAAEFAVEKGPELVEDTIKPKLEEAGGPMGLVTSLAGGDGAGSQLLSKLMPGGDDDEDGGGAGDGTGKGRRMPIQQAVDVAAPIDVVYDQFTQFEDFPKFMHRVESVEQKDDATVVFNVKTWGFRRRWEAEIVEQRPDERIVWESVSGLQHTGVVTFHELAERLTRIELNIDIDPSGPIEKIARGARFAKRAARGDLKRFKAYMEMHEDETGAWRGEIQDGDVVTEDGEYDEQYEDEEYEDEPAAEYEDEEPEAEYEDEEEPEEEPDEPEAEADEDEPEAEADEDEPEAEADQDEEEPEEKPRSRSRSRSSSSNGSSKSESAAPKRSRASSKSGSSNGSSKSKATSGKSSSSRSKSSSSKSSSSKGSTSKSGSSRSRGSGGGSSSRSTSRGRSKSGGSSKSRSKASSSKS